jgi:hypothetical protein
MFQVYVSISVFPLTNRETLFVSVHFFSTCAKFFHVNSFFEFRAFARAGAGGRKEATAGVFHWTGRRHLLSDPKGGWREFLILYPLNKFIAIWVPSSSFN